MFIGREKELKTLRKLTQGNIAHLVVIKGRRRIGKSRLLQEFAKDFDRAFAFSGLVPNERTTAQSQRDEFLRQLKQQTSMGTINPGDWGDIFDALAEYTSKRQVLILLDEITWMGDKDPTFLGKLKNAWDLYFKNNPQLTLIICGSSSQWIERNILSHTGFLGRESLTLTLQEMPLSDCVKFWGEKQSHISAYEKLKLLAVTGGVPRYLESINPNVSAEQNIQQLCFSPSGILFNEFEKIFSDLFSSRNKLYKNIIECLVNGVATQDEIVQHVGLAKSGDISEYMDDLIVSGFVSRDFTWNLKNQKISRLSHYRLKDNYSRFYLKYIAPNKERIELGNMENIALSQLPYWPSTMGLQVENLCLSNRHLIKEALGIVNSDIICDNPFFQRSTKLQAGCQIDYLIHTRHHVLYICEIKFSAKEVGKDVISEVQKKCKRIKIPKHVSLRPVLIHVNGISESVEEQQYFSEIIDISDFL